MKIYIPILIFLISCFTQTPKRTTDEIHQFGMNKHRTGVQYVKYDEKKLKDLKTMKSDWSKNATEITPLYIKDANKNILIFGTYDNEIKAYDLKTKSILWTFKYEIALLTTPVYDPENKIIYALMTNTQDMRLIALDLDGKLLSSLIVEVLENYHENNPKLTPDDISMVYNRTALGLNKINKKPYLFFATTNSKGSASKYLEKNAKYGMTKGVTGLVMAYFLEEDGKFSKNKPMLFFTNKISDDKYSGFNSGVYLSGSAITLLDDNSLILATGNGYTNPTKHQYGCSLLKLNGSNLKLFNENSYYSVDSKGYQECFNNSIELTSSYPVAINHQNKYYYWLIDKSSNLYFFTEKNGNLTLADKLTYAQLETDSSYPIYSGGNIFIADNEVNIITRSNNHWDYTEAKKIVSDISNENFLKEIGYQKQECLGVLNKKGNKEDEIKFYFTGPNTQHYLIGKSIINKKVTNPQLSQYEELKGIQSTTVKDWYTPYLELNTIGHSVDKNVTLKNYPLRKFQIYALTKKRGKRFLKFLSAYTPPEAQKGTEVIPIKKNSFNFFYNQTDEIDCHSVSDQYKKIYIYKKPNRKLAKGFVLKNYKYQNGLKKVWDLKSNNNDHIYKNSLITLINSEKDTRHTLFTALNNDTGDSYLYIVDSKEPKIIARKKFKGIMHFSHLIYTKYGIFIPTQENGIQHFSFNYHKTKRGKIK